MPYTIDAHGNVTLTIPETDNIKERFDLKFQVDTNLTSIDQGFALGYLEDVISGEYGAFMQRGCRNNQAVNMSIALDVLGYYPLTWLGEYLPDIKEHVVCEITVNDQVAFEDHLCRVASYLDAWSYDPWAYTIQ